MKDTEADFSIKDLFVPLTLTKVIWIFIILGFLVFSNMLFNNFVGDDKVYMVNYFPFQTINFSSFFGTNLYNTGGQYRPLGIAFLFLLYSAFGNTPFFYHLSQLLLHISCTVLIFTLFRKFLSPKIAFFSALIFLIHPIQVESVSYIAQSASLLLFLFGITALHLSMGKKISNKMYIVLFCLLTFSLFIKEIGVLFILNIVVYSFLFDVKKIPKFLIVGFVSGGIYSFFRLFVGHIVLETRSLTPIARLDFGERVLNIPLIVLYYLKAVVFPISLAWDQQWVITKINFDNFYLPLILDLLFFITIFLLGIVLFRYYKQLFRGYLFFLIWFIAGFLMIIQIYPLDTTVADRWFYYPLAGLLGMVGVCLEVIDKRYTLGMVGLTLAVFIITSLSIRTVVRNSNWADPITLMSHDIKVSENPNLDENLAYELISKDQYKEALGYLQKSVDEDPTASTIYDLGYTYEKLHEYQKAKQYYVMDINRFTDQKNAPFGQDEVLKNVYSGLARVNLLNEDPQTTKELLRKLITDDPDNGTYWAYLAIAEYKIGNQKQALADAEKAKKLLNNASADLLFSRIENKQPLNLIGL